jgi:putative toxin-antitoxin system antitoxin component (TIGR02293 family)
VANTKPKQRHEAGSKAGKRVRVVMQSKRASQFLVSPAELEALSKHGYSNDEVYQIVAPRRTLARRKANDEPLTVAESDRVLRLERISEMAARVFGQAEKARLWLRRENKALDGLRPIDLLASETGAHMVEEELTRIDYGMFA